MLVLLVLAPVVALFAATITARILVLRRRRHDRAEARLARERGERLQERVYRRELRGERHLEPTDPAA